MRVFIGSQVVNLTRLRPCEPESERQFPVLSIDQTAFEGGLAQALSAAERQCCHARHHTAGVLPFVIIRQSRFIFKWETGAENLRRLALNLGRSHVNDWRQRR